jgi:hypothetical protein
LQPSPELVASGTHDDILGYTVSDTSSSTMIKTISELTVTTGKCNKGTIAATLDEEDLGSDTLCDLCDSL